MKITIKGVPPYDGEYPLEFDRLSNGQIRTIKRLSGYTPPEYIQAGERGDNDFLVAAAIAAVQRSGRHQVVHEQAFWDAEAGGIDFVLDEEDAMAGPPPTAPEAETRSTPSGEPSKPGSDTPQVSRLRSTGTDS